MNLKKTNYVSFKQANVNIMALSDTHGNLGDVISLYQNYKNNKNDIFTKSEDKSSLNLLTIVGDWFMNPKSNGYLGFKKFNSGDFQSRFLDSFIKNVKKDIPQLNALYTPGNHCLDGGDKELIKNISKLPMATILTNANINDSKNISKLPQKFREKFQEYKILEVQDDKNEKIKHKVLILGTTPINLPFLVQEDYSGIDFFGMKNKKEADISPEDIFEVAETIKSNVQKFKENNPKGAVILMNHAGNPIAESIVKHVEDIDLVLNGHDHLDKTTKITTATGKETKIVSLSENSTKLEKVKLHFDDNGEISISSQPFYTDFSQNQDDNALNKLYYKFFKEDIKPIVKLHDPKKRENLGLEGIRFKNSDLANYCTDAIHKKIQEENGNLNATILPSTAFREALPVSRPITNLDTMNMFKGIVGENAHILVGNIKGEVLGNFIIQNIKDNLENPTRNTIIQSSGIIINKTKMAELLSDSCETDEKLLNCIKIKNSEGKFEIIESKKSYYIALPKKLFEKSTDKEFYKAQEKFIDTKKTPTDYFRMYISSGLKDPTITSDKRIL